MEQTLQQPKLIELPISTQCFHCASTQQTVLRDREVIVARMKYSTECVCCSPDSESRCPHCGSGSLEFGMHYATSQDDQGGEVFRCKACGATGEADDAAPPVQPWAELAAVAERREPLPRIWPAALPGCFLEAQEMA